MFLVHNVVWHVSRQLSKMLFTCLLVITVSSFVSSAYAQSQEISDAEARVSAAAEGSKAHTTALLALAEAYLAYDPNIAIEKAEDVIVRSQQQGLLAVEGRAHWLVGFGFVRQGVIGPDLLHITVALERAQQTGDVELEIDSLRLMGVHFDYREDISQALKYLLLSYDLALEKGFESLAAIAKNNVGYILIKEGRPDEAVEHLRTSVALSSEDTSKRNLGLALANLGVALSEGTSSENGITELERAIVIAREIQNMAILGYASQGLGAAYMRVGDLRVAETTYLEAIADERLHNFPEYMLKTYLGLGAVYYTQGLEDEAEETYLAGLEVMKGLSALAPQLELYTQLAKVAVGHEDYRSAYRYELAQRKTREAMQPIADKGVVDTLNDTLKYREQEKALMQADADKEFAFLVMLSLAALVVLMVVIFYLISRSRKQKMALASERAMRLRLQRDELSEEATNLKTIMAARNKIFANTSHDLRHPLAMIISISEMLASTKLDEKQRELVRYIDESAVLQSQLISDILDLTQFEQGIFKVKNTTDTYQKAMAPAVEGWRSLAARADITFDISYGGGTKDKLDAPFGRVLQVTGNLVANALKYTPNGSINVAVARDGDVMKITVRDTGQGIDNSVLPSLFERFTQEDSNSDEAASGAGIGLSICNELVHYWGGDIGATSVIGEGSVFWFTVPLDCSTAPSESA